MVSEKRILVGGRNLFYGTSIKASPEINTQTTATFDGNVVQGSDTVAWTIECSRLRYDTGEHYRQISEMLDDMLVHTKTVTVIDTVHKGSETFVIRDVYYQALLEDNGYELKPHENTVENLKFKASKRARFFD